MRGLHLDEGEAARLDRVLQRLRGSLDGVAVVPVAGLDTAPAGGRVSGIEVAQLAS